MIIDFHTHIFPHAIAERTMNKLAACCKIIDATHLISTFCRACYTAQKQYEFNLSIHITYGHIVVFHYIGETYQCHSS